MLRRGEYCLREMVKVTVLRTPLCCTDGDCDSMLCQACQEGSCVDICTAQGLVLNGLAAAYAAFIETATHATSADTCCDGGVCCNATCQTTYTYCGDVCDPGQLLLS